MEWVMAAGWLARQPCGGRMLARRWAGLAVLLVCMNAPALAQRDTQKPIRLVIGTAPGGLMDVPARLLAEYLDRTGGERLIIENRPGAGGNPAADLVAKALPDGYTLGQIQLGNVAINPFIYKNMPFDPLTDLVPVAPLTSSPLLVLVGSRLPVADLREFIALARRSPGGINHGSAGIGTVPHLGGQLFEQLSGAQLVHVHYRGVGPAVIDLVGGQVQVVFAGLGAVRGQIEAGSVKVLAVAQRTRLKSAPQFPTAEEAGLPGFEFTTWFGIVAPRGTPERIVEAFAARVRGMQHDPEVQRRLGDAGMEVLEETPTEFGNRIRRDNARFREIVRAAGLKPE